MLLNIRGSYLMSQTNATWSYTLRPRTGNQLYTQTKHRQPVIQAAQAQPISYTPSPSTGNQLYAQFENELYNFKIIFGVDAGVIIYLAFCPFEVLAAQYVLCVCVYICVCVCVFLCEFSV